MRKRSAFYIALLLCAALLSGCASEAEESTAAWPTHEPGATPYVRLMPSEGELRAQAEATEQEPQEYGSPQELLRSLYDEVGSFYIKSDEREMFLELPQDEPFSFVAHVFPDYGSDPRLQELSDKLNGESVESEEAALERWSALMELENQLYREYTIRTAEEFAAQGCDCEVRVLRSDEYGIDFEGYICIVTATPERLWELSGTMERLYHIEQLYDSVDRRFTETVWPE